MLIKGPFQIKWGDNTVTDVESIDVDHSIDSEDFDTLDGRSFEVDGSHKVSAVISLLASDLPSLAALLPQNFVENGGVMSTGETVDNADGAIDVVARDCDADVFNNLDILSCAAVPSVARIVNARTKFEGYEVDNKIQKVMVKIVGEAAADEASIQFFKDGTINVVS